MHPVVIIGTGLAGYNLAREFRKLDDTTPLYMVTADDGQFYSKPMLSNALTNGKTPETLIITHTDRMSEQLSAVIRTNTVVMAIDTGTRQITLGKETLSYGKLILAVGAEPVHPPLQGDANSKVLSINNLDDYAFFRKAITASKRIAILGPGLIGCEFANDLTNAGKDVTVIGPDPAPLGRLLPPEAGSALQEALARIGIKWCLGVVADEVNFHDNGYRIRLSDGTHIDTDTVLSAVGLRPNVRLAKETSLKVNHGIVVDRTLETSAKGVFALGDCMEVEGLVLPFVMPITHCARALAKTLAEQTTTLSYPAMPVVVKTPAHPVVVSPPPPTASGHWQTTKVDNGVRAEFRDDNNRLLGFALTGSAVAAKQTLTRELPPLLP